MRDSLDLSGVVLVIIIVLTIWAWWPRDFDKENLTKNKIEMRTCPVCQKEDMVKLNPYKDPRFNPSGSSGYDSLGNRNGYSNVKLICERCNIEFEVSVKYGTISEKK